MNKTNSMNKKNKNNFIKSIVIKSLIVTFYLAILAFFLYLPRVYKILVPKSNEITVYTTRETLPIEKFVEFERLTGIHVHVAYYDTNEELFAKLKINKGVGYDLIAPSDYMIEHLIKENLFQPLDLSKISNFSSIDKRLLYKFYDPENKYTLPLLWIPYGLGYDKRSLKLDNNTSWDIVFKPDVLKKLGDYKVSMLNDAHEAVFLAAIYLFGEVDNFTPERLKKIEDFLIAQKPIVESYSETGAKYLLLSRIVPLAVIPSARLKEIDDMKNYGFVIPKEGSIVDIMSLGIPASSKKADLAHKLIDFLLSKEVGVYNFEKHDCNPANKESYGLIDKRYFKNKAFFPDDEVFDRLFILNNKIRAKRLESIWFLVKSA